MFKNAHVFFILKKKKLRDEELNIKHKLEIENSRMYLLNTLITVDENDNYQARSRNRFGVNSEGY